MIQLPGIDIFVGTISDLNRKNDQEWAFVHATQTSHYKKLGWNRTTNKPDKNHPNYIICEDSNHLYLNWVDGAAYLYEWSEPETFIETLDFIEKWVKEKRVLIHCDQGQSRAPTLGLLYLAKRSKTIPNDSFLSAKNEFVRIYPNYLPSGIGDYVSQRWSEIS